MACRVRHREIGTATPPPRLSVSARAPRTPSTREAPYAIAATHAIDKIAATPPTRYRRDSRLQRRRRTLPPNADGKKPTLVQLKYGGARSASESTRVYLWSTRNGIDVFAAMASARADLPV